MKGTGSSINRHARRRERRVNIQNEYIQRYHCPVISFCMEYSGTYKDE